MKERASQTETRDGVTGGVEAVPVGPEFLMEWGGGAAEVKQEVEARMPQGLFKL